MYWRLATGDHSSPSLTKAQENKRTQTVPYGKTIVTQERERKRLVWIFSRLNTGEICTGCFEYICTHLSHRRNAKELVPMVWVMKVVWPSVLYNSFQKLISTTVAISHGRHYSPSNVTTQSKITSWASIKGKALPLPKLASGTNIIGILINHKIALRVEWHSASFTLSIYSLSLFKKNTAIKKDKKF